MGKLNKLKHISQMKSTFEITLLTLFASTDAIKLMGGRDLSHFDDFEATKSLVRTFDDEIKIVLEERVGHMPGLNNTEGRKFSSHLLFDLNFEPGTCLNIYSMAAYAASHAKAVRDSYFQVLDSKLE